jgi:glycosyltransferase involved in cell wall biosynthesis
LDCYVPIYVEVSARDSKNKKEEYKGYMEESARYNRVLMRGDYFLCANEVQKIYYTGVLSSLQLINPRSYREDRLLIVPFGIESSIAKATMNPYVELGISKDDFVVLWFGGLYPWFRVEEYLDAIQNLKSEKNIKFVFVGTKNPFNPNPDFFRQHEKAYDFAKTNNLLDKKVYFIDWVDFDTRANWYKHADIVVSLNQPGEENTFSWRTRVIDFVWGELAMITNGGDPLSEELIHAGGATRLQELSGENLSTEIMALYKNKAKLKAMRNSVAELKRKYYWENITKILAKTIETSLHPYADEMSYSKNLGINILQPAKKNKSLPSKVFGKAGKAVGLGSKMYSYAKRKGLKTSAGHAYNLAKNQVELKTTSKGRRFIFISNPINNTGAPLVLLQIIEEFVAKYGASRVQVIASHITPESMLKLREMGVKVDKAAEVFTYRIIKLQLGLRKDDFVLINTVAIHDNYRAFIFKALKTGKLNHANWFIHEDIAQLNIIAPHLMNKSHTKEISRLLSNDKLSIYTPSQQTKLSYDKLFGTEKVGILPLHLPIDKKYHVSRKPSDYENINFLLSGSPSDGRKAQLLAITAFYEYLEKYYNKNPKKYRDFTFHLVSIGDDYYSKQIEWMGSSLLKKHVKFYPNMPYKEVLKITQKCNAVICCSLNETFALYVAEGMYMGHIVLRNNSAGMDEQLVDGKNGYYIDHTDINQFASRIEKILNKKTNSNTDLQNMGKTSQKLIEPYSKNTYLDKFLNEK